MFERLIVAALATWRISSLFLYETGPFDAFMHVRTLASRTLFTAELFSCIYCLSIWIGLLCAVVMLTDWWLALIPFALSSVAIGLNRCLRLQ